MLQPFPSPLKTSRLIIRTPEPGDADQLNEAVLETWDQLATWMPWAINRPTLQESRETCIRMAAHAAERKDFALFGFERDTGVFLLASGTHPRNIEVPSFEIGYWCRASRQGQGLVSEAVEAITSACLHKMLARRIEIRCDKRNAASRAVALKAGYVMEAELKNDARDNHGALRTTQVFAVSRDD
jgi:ribosomal-protein-serine acetyltransferase